MYILTTVSQENSERIFCVGCIEPCILNENRKIHYLLCMKSHLPFAKGYSNVIISLKVRFLSKQ